MWGAESSSKVYTVILRNNMLFKAAGLAILSTFGGSGGGCKFDQQVLYTAPVAHWRKILGITINWVYGGVVGPMNEGEYRMKNDIFCSIVIKLCQLFVFSQVYVLPTTRKKGGRTCKILSSLFSRLADSPTLFWILCSRGKKNYFFPNQTKNIIAVSHHFSHCLLFQLPSTHLKQYIYHHKIHQNPTKTPSNQFTTPLRFLFFVANNKSAHHNALLSSAFARLPPPPTHSPHDIPHWSGEQWDHIGVHIYLCECWSCIVLFFDLWFLHLLALPIVEAISPPSTKGLLGHLIHPITLSGFIFCIMATSPIPRGGLPTQFEWALCALFWRLGDNPGLPLDCSIFIICSDHCQSQQALCITI